MKLRPGYVRRNVLRAILIFIVLPIMLVASFGMLVMLRPVDEQIELWSDWYGTLKNGFL